MYMFSYWYAIGFMVIVFLVGGGLTLSGITEREIQEECSFTRIDYVD